MKKVKKISCYAILGGAVLLSACSTTIPSGKLDYGKKAEVLSPLEIPPDLGQLPKSTRYTVENGTASIDMSHGLAASVPKEAGAAPVSAAVSAAKASANDAVSPQKIGNVSIEQTGNQRWLLTSQNPQEVWKKLQTFWGGLGFKFKTDDEKLGVLETEWTENKALIQTGFANASVNKLLESLYSTPYRDKFITSVERTADGKTAIYIVHRGMYQIYTNERSDHTVWQPAKPNPMLEAEIMRRAMVALGSTPQEAKVEVAKSEQQPDKSAAPITKVNGQDAIVLADTPSDAWRIVGAAIDRAGFTQIDRDRTGGVYWVRYVAGNGDDAPGFFSKLFSKKKAESTNKYQISLTAASDKKRTVIQVKDDKGVVASDATAVQILKVLSENIL